jgi:hypothetical protein
VPFSLCVNRSPFWLGRQMAGGRLSCGFVDFHSSLGFQAAFTGASSSCCGRAMESLTAPMGVDLPNSEAPEGSNLPASTCGNYCSVVTVIFLEEWHCGCNVLQKHTRCAEFTHGNPKQRRGNVGPVHSSGTTRTANRGTAVTRLRQRGNRKAAKNGAAHCKGALQPAVSPFWNHQWN